MNMQRLFDWLDRHGHAVRTVAAPTLVASIAAVYGLVYLTGGIKYVYSHTMYIPILLAGMIFGIRGGLLFGLLGGIALGPYMPIVVATGEQQQAINWLYRTGIFASIGLLCGLASDAARYYMEHLKWLTFHDTSTGLPNRSSLIDKLYGLSRETRAGDYRTLIVTSMANRMELKSAFGYGIIERAMEQLAQRFKSGQADRHIYRTDTGQLAVLLLMDRAQAERVLDDLVEASKEPILFNEIPIHIDMRMGFAGFSRIEDAPEAYLRRAEAALNEAYEREQDRIAYQPEMTTVADQNLAILGELKEAIAQKQLLLHYQPKVGIVNGGIHGAEALMRWNHPVRGNIPPGKFIPRAEQSTLIHLLAEFALDHAMGQVVQWQKQGIDVAIAVNISPQNLLHPGFTDLVLRLLDQHGLSGDRLELEVTERALMLDMDHAIGELARLAGAKLMISIDDFGTGYSSLQYLHRLPISLIKIDQSFVRDLPNDQGAAYIVDAAVTLAHKMGMKTVAEGIENQEALDFLGDIGCDVAQGYLISHPLPSEKFAQWYMQYDGVLAAT